MESNWIVIDPNVCAGRPHVRGTRITVELILDKLAAGESMAQVMKSHPRLTQDSVRAAIAFASESLKSESVYPIEPGP